MDTFSNSYPVISSTILLNFIRCERFSLDGSIPPKQPKFAPTPAILTCLRFLNFSLVLIFRRKACEQVAIWEIKSFLEQTVIKKKEYKIVKLYPSNFYTDFGLLHG